MIKDVTTIIVARGARLFIIMAWIIIHFGRNPRKGGSPPRESNEVNIINLVIVMSLFVIMVWLINDVPDSLMVNTTVTARVE